MNKELILTTATAKADAATMMEEIISAASEYYKTRSGLESWERFSCAFDENAQRLFKKCAGSIEEARRLLKKNRAYFNRRAIAYEKAYPGTFGYVSETAVDEFLEAFGL